MPKKKLKERQMQMLQADFECPLLQPMKKRMKQQMLLKKPQRTSWARKTGKPMALDSIRLPIAEHAGQSGEVALQ